MNYGKVIFEQKEYTLTSNADYTNRLLNGPRNYHEASEGQKYFFEMSADAVDSEGNEYTVYWIFDDVMGEETPLDNFDYDDVDRVEEK